MKKEAIVEFLDDNPHKDVKLVIENGFLYSGQIKSLHDDSLIFIDKYGGRLVISYENITSILDWTGHPGKNKIGAWP